MADGTEGGTGTPTQTQVNDSSSVVNLGDPSAITTPIEPQSPGSDPQSLPEGIKAEDLNAALKQVAGVEDYTTLSGLVKERETYKKQFLELNDKYRNLEQQAKLNPYSNDFVKQVDQFFREGRSMDQISKFFELHSRDVNSMLPKDAMVQKYVMENPGVTPNDAWILIESDLPELPRLDENSTQAEKERAAAIERRREAIINAKGAQAKQWLGDQRKSFVDPDVQAKQVQQQQVQRAWEDVSRSLVNEGVTLGFEFKDDKIGTYEHPGYKVSLSKEEAEQVSQLVAQYAVTNNMTFNAVNRPKLIEYRDALVRNLKHEEYMANIFRDVHAELSKYFVQMYAQGPNGQAGQFAGANRQTQPTGPKKSGLPQPKAGDSHF